MEEPVATTVVYVPCLPTRHSFLVVGSRDRPYEGSPSGTRRRTGGNLCPVVDSPPSLPSTPFYPRSPSPRLNCGRNQRVITYFSRLDLSSTGIPELEWWGSAPDRRVKVPEEELKDRSPAPTSRVPVLPFYP